MRRDATPKNRIPRGTAGSESQIMKPNAPEQEDQPGRLVDAQGLLNELFQPESRPSLEWLRRRTRARAIPSIRVGRLIFYDPPAVREKLAVKNTVHAK